MRRSNSHGLAVALALVVAHAARAQVTPPVSAVPLTAAAGKTTTIHGNVFEDGTRAPIGNATAVVRDANDSVVASVVASSGGKFVIHLSLTEPGEFQVAARRLGYEPRSVEHVVLHPGDSIDVVFSLPKLAIVLDTVRAKASRGIFSLTPGSEYFAEHYRAGKGIFISGHELVWSKLTTCDFFGHLDGLVRVSMSQAPGATGIACDDNTFITSAALPHCLQTEFDRVGPVIWLEDDEFEVRQASNLDGGSSGQAGSAGSLGRGGGVAGAAGGGRGSHTIGGSARVPAMRAPGGASRARTGAPAPLPPFTNMDSVFANSLGYKITDIAGAEVYRDRTEMPADYLYLTDATRKCVFLRVWSWIAWE